MGGIAGPQHLESARAQGEPKIRGMLDDSVKSRSHRQEGPQAIGSTRRLHDKRSRSHGQVGANTASTSFSIGVPGLFTILHGKVALAMLNPKDIRMAKLFPPRGLRRNAPLMEIPGDRRKKGGHLTRKSAAGGFTPKYATTFGDIRAALIYFNVDDLCDPSPGASRIRAARIQRIRIRDSGP